MNEVFIVTWIDGDGRAMADVYSSEIRALEDYPELLDIEPDAIEDRHSDGYSLLIRSIDA